VPAEPPIDDLAPPINSRKWEAHMTHGASTDTHIRSRSMGTCTQRADFQTHIPSSSGSSGGEAPRDGGGGHDGGFERSMPARAKAFQREQLSRVVQQELPVPPKEVRVPVVLLEQQGAELLFERSRAKNTR
jgi:hypothetical protein